MATITPLHTQLATLMNVAPTSLIGLSQSGLQKNIDRLSPSTPTSQYQGMTDAQILYGDKPRNTGVVPQSQNPTTNPNIGRTWGDISTNGALPLTPTKTTTPSWTDSDEYKSLMGQLTGLQTKYDNLYSLYNTSNRGNTNSNTTDTTRSLGTLYPRVNWGNYQSTGRGSRYFNPMTGNYDSFGAQQASL